MVLNRPAPTVQPAFTIAHHSRKAINMSAQVPNSNAALLDLLRIAGPLSHAEIARAMGVSRTAVQQRLTRLSNERSIQCEVVKYGQGRPRYRYWLTEQGMQLTAGESAELAVRRWEEVQQSRGPEQRAAMLRRISEALALAHDKRRKGQATAEPMKEVVQLLAEGEAHHGNTKTAGEPRKHQA